MTSVFVEFQTLVYSMCPKNSSYWSADFVFPGQYKTCLLPTDYSGVLRLVKLSTEQMVLGRFTSSQPMWACIVKALCPFTRLHVSTCTHITDVNHSLGELLLWKASDFFINLLLYENRISLPLDFTLPYWYLISQVKILAQWTRKQHGDLLALFPAKLTGCIAAGVQQSD